MKMDASELPAALQTCYENWVRDATDADVLDYASRHPSIARGFRRSKSNVGMIKKLILKRVQAGSEISADLKQFLSGASPLADGLYCLSSSVLLKCWPDLLACYGHDAVAAALLDERKPVRQRAVDALPKLDTMTADKPPKARAALTRIVNSVCAALEDSLVFAAEEDQPSEPPAEERPAESGETDKLKAQIETLEAELKEHRTKSRTLHAVQGKLDKSESRVKDLTAALAQAEARVRSLEAELKIRTAERDDANKAAAEVKGGLRRAVQSGIRQELATLQNRWLLPLMTAENAARAVAARNATPDNLDACIEAALRKQADTDRHSGNMRQLRSRLNELAGKAALLDRAIADAVHPLPELPLLREELDREIAGIRKIVEANTAPLSEGAARIRAIIANVSTGDALQEVRALIEVVAAHGILPGEEIRALYRAYSGKMAQLYAQFGPRIVQAAGAHSPDPLADILRRDSTAGRIFVAIDGYNVILGLPEIFKPFLTPDGKPADAARDRFASLLVPLFAGRSDCDVRVFFDSDTRSEQGHSHNVMTVFSGGKGAHRADTVLLEELRAYRKGYAGATLIVVTNDQDLRAQARSERAVILPVDAFAGLLHYA